MDYEARFNDVEITLGGFENIIIRLNLPNLAFMYEIELLMFKDFSLNYIYGALSN